MNTRRRASHREQASQTHDGRTVALVLLASVGAVVMAFVLGIHVGQDSAPAEPAAVEGSALRTLDSQAARLRQRRAQERTELSFHEALTGPARAAPARPAAAPAASATPAPPATAPLPAEPSPATAPAPTPAEDPAPATGTEPSTVAEQVEAAVDEPDGTAAPARFSLQVGAFPDERSAAGLRQRLQARGYQVRIATSEVEGRGTWYRVRVGSYADRDSAESQRDRLSSGEGLFALVVPET